MKKQTMRVAMHKKTGDLCIQRGLEISRKFEVEKGPFAGCIVTATGTYYDEKTLRKYFKDLGPL